LFGPAAVLLNYNSTMNKELCVWLWSTKQLEVLILGAYCEALQKILNFTQQLSLKKRCSGC